MRIPKSGLFVSLSLILHLFILGLISFFWQKPLEVVDSALKPEPIQVQTLALPPDEEIPPPAEIPDTTQIAKAKASKAKKTPKTPPAPSSDSLPILAFDSTGSCAECLAQPEFPDPEFFQELGVDSSWAEVLVKIDTSGQVVEVYDKSFVEEGLNSQDHKGEGPVKLYDANIQRGSQFWANSYETALKWNFYRAARHAKPGISRTELQALYPPGKWILQKVRFKNPRSKL